MADTVNTITVLNSPTLLVLTFTNLSDGTGESNVKKVDVSTFTGAGQPAKAISSVLIEKIIYDIGGMEVDIIANGTSPIVLQRLSGWGTIDMERFGGLNTVNAGSDGGDVNFTTHGATSGDSYSITLQMRKVGG